MRTNPAGFALTVGMGLIVLLLGFLGLSATGLVGYAAADAAVALQKQVSKQDSVGQKEFYCLGPGGPASTHVPASPKEMAAVSNGDALFKANCTQCHAVNEKVVGPALAGITRRRTMSWIVAWVHNPAKVVSSGDDYAAKLFSDYDKQQMPAFKLSDKDIADITVWINSQDNGGPVVVN